MKECPVQRAIVVTMLILGVFSDVCAKEPEPAEVTGKGLRLKEVPLTAGPPESYTGSVTHAGAASAHTAYQVTLYGVADLDIAYSKNSKDPSAPAITSGNRNGSCLGLKGNDDPGAGLKAVVQLVGYRSGNAIVNIMSEQRTNI